MKHLPAKCEKCAAELAGVGLMDEPAPALRFVIEGPVVSLQTTGARFVRTVAKPMPTPTTWVEHARIIAHGLFVECMKCGHRHRVPSNLFEVTWDTPV